MSAYRRPLPHLAHVDRISTPAYVQRVEDIPNSLFDQSLELLLPRHGVGMRHAQARPADILRSQALRPQAVVPEVLGRSRRVQLARLPQHLELLGAPVDICIVRRAQGRGRKGQVSQPDAAEVPQLAVLGQEARSTRFGERRHGVCMLQRAQRKTTATVSSEEQRFRYCSGDVGVGELVAREGCVVMEARSLINRLRSRTLSRGSCMPVLVITGHSVSHRAAPYRNHASTPRLATLHAVDTHSQFRESFNFSNIMHVVSAMLCKVQSPLLSRGTLHVSMAADQNG